MKPRTVYVSFTKYNQAEHNWDKLYNEGKRRGAYFWKFLGNNLELTAHDFNYPIVDGYMVTEESSAKIEMLASPHYHALMKAFIIRTGYHRKLP